MKDTLDRMRERFPYIPEPDLEYGLARDEKESDPESIAKMQAETLRRRLSPEVDDMLERMIKEAKLRHGNQTE